PVSPLNLVDITAQLSTDPHLLAARLRLILDSGGYDAPLAIFGVYANVPALSPVVLQDLAKLRAACHGTRMAVSVVCPPHEAAPASRLAFALALKVLSPDILHKTEVGGVVLGIASARAAQAGAEAMLRRVAAAAAEAKIEGILLSEMVAPGPELILGTRRDPV